MFFSKNWNIRKFGTAVFQFAKIFEKPFSNFEFCFEMYVKQYLDAYIFWGKCTLHSQLIQSFEVVTRLHVPFPQEYQASKKFLRMQ